MSSELPSNDIIETLALNANAILAPDEIVVKRGMMPEQLTLNEIGAAVVAIERNCKASYCPGMACDVCSYGNASRKLLAMADEIKVLEARDE